MKQKKIPQRMCVVCRAHKDKEGLIRVVKPKDADIMIDYSHKLSGRGAYVCKDVKCVQKLVKERRLNRAFKQNVSEDVYAALIGLSAEMGAEGDLGANK